jgi:energy-coupling factor transport system permease protein
MKDLDPRTKLFIAVIVSSTAVIMNSSYALIALMIFVLIIIKVFSIPFYRLIGRLKKLIMLLITVAVMQVVFTTSGKVLIDLPFVFGITDRGIFNGIAVILRMLAILFSASILATSKPGELASGIAAMKLPYEIVFMVYIGIRFLPYLSEELKDSFISVQLAGVDLKKISLKDKLNVFTYIFTPAVISALTRARQIAIAAEMRGFRSSDRRTFYKKPIMRPVDFYVIIVVLLINTGIIILNYRGV